ncbi:MAG: hypothetical protein HWQ41_18060 [Nostoc sp. NOS(2021)]|uniref:hypothetical protein n=1 Tax=Nostoc sp. NOS(2021) TaxID=2815407 RepID=UPI0025FFAE00|nr:hypothetical protein [Nostoc sp. NOS(2021)]MBN3897106.1 hypothetical protein [Nostoc sp. NOS(2021)]
MPTQIPKASFVVGTNKIVTLEDVYDEIGDVCGVVKADAAALPDDSESISVRQLVSSGVGRRALVRLKDKTTKTVYFAAANCTKIGALVGLDYVPGNVILSARFPQHIKMY